MFGAPVNVAQRQPRIAEQPLMNDARAPMLVVFDCDGVLVDSEPIASRVFAEALTEIGFPLTSRQAIDRHIGIGLP